MEPQIKTMPESLGGLKQSSTIVRLLPMIQQVVLILR